MTVLNRWHDAMTKRDPSLLDDLIAEECVFYSPVVHTPQRGKALTEMYLTAAMHVLGNSQFRYVREIAGEHEAMLEFETVNDGITINGVDIFTWNADGKIDSFKVMVRPLKAVNMLHANMQAMLESFSAGAPAGGGPAAD